VGVDVFVHAGDASADYLAGRLQTLTHQPRPAGFKLQMITNRGVKVWPGGFPETFCTDHWRCRFVGVDNQGAPRDVSHDDILALLHNLASDGLDFIKTEHLCSFDGQAGYALGQGQ
jgi:isocitrate dehydrogenase